MLTRQGPNDKRALLYSYPGMYLFFAGTHY